jgi:hypothetical protein
MSVSCLQSQVPHAMETNQGKHELRTILADSKDLNHHFATSGGLGGGGSKLQGLLETGGPAVSMICSTP